MAINDLAKYGYKPDMKCKSLIINYIIFRNAAIFLFNLFSFKEEQIFLKMKNIELNPQEYSFFFFFGSKK
jgi:hypothetical protein